jgi:hypothetical protein
MSCEKCAGGWICEEHPDKPWPHDDCLGPGMPCDAPGCELSLLDLTPDDPAARERMIEGVKRIGGTVVCE